jgi:hypothetical protein
MIDQGSPSRLRTTFAKCLAGMTPPEPPCNRTRDCGRAGGYYYCQVIRPFEQRRDREMDAEMRERQKNDPAFAEEQRQWVAQLLAESQPVDCDFSLSTEIVNRSLAALCFDRG